MRTFDCTAQDCPIFGPHLLEASAGTGKTFAIEHVFVRLILESGENPIELEQILAVTFTRAAARELRARIRANLDRAIASSDWEYLRSFANSQEAFRHLREARGVFDRCQIFTIHGFCYRILQEFAFEANLKFSFPDPEGPQQISKRMRREVSHFLEKIDGDLLCPEQMAHLLKGYDSIGELGKALLKAERFEKEPRRRRYHLGPDVRPA